MWQVYLYLANERQAIEHRNGLNRRAEGESRLRRWRNARRTTGTSAVQPVAAQAR